MIGTPANERFQDSTRGQVVARLRRGPATVEELAKELKLTDNAIRPHLTSLERDGMVCHAGVRRTPSAGKPASLYELHPNAETMLSRAYAPVLEALVDVLSAELPPAQLRKMLRATGKKLAIAAGGRAKGDLQARARAAADILSSFGGEVEVERKRGEATLRGIACPLAAAVGKDPNVCCAVESMVGEITGDRVTEHCDRSGRPRCCFSVKPAA